MGGLEDKEMLTDQSKRLSTQEDDGSPLVDEASFLSHHTLTQQPKTGADFQASIILVCLGTCWDSPIRASSRGAGGHSLHPPTPLFRLKFAPVFLHSAPTQHSVLSPHLRDRSFLRTDATPSQIPFNSPLSPLLLYFFMPVFPFPPLTGLTLRLSISVPKELVREKIEGMKGPSR